MYGILAAFCERDRGQPSNRLYRYYENAFPRNVAFRQMVRVVPYPERAA